MEGKVGAHGGCKVVDVVYLFYFIINILLFLCYNMLDNMMISKPSLVPTMQEGYGVA